MSSWRFEWVVAWRFLREGRFQSLLILAGVAAGVAVVAYITALVVGLQRNTLIKTLGTQAHIVLSAPDDQVRSVLVPSTPGPTSTREQVWSDTQARAQTLRSVANWRSLIPALKDDPMVQAVSPVVTGAALVRRGEATRSVSVTGVDLPLYLQVVKLDDKLVAGELKLGTGDAMIGTVMASELGVSVGDRLRVVTADRSDDVRITALLDYGLRELNRRAVLVPLRSAQSLFDLPGGATQLDITVRDVQAAQRVARAWADRAPYKLESWQDSNAQLVSALNAQSISTFIIRSVVMVVVILGIASVLVVSVVQKQREIGILRAMGITRGQVMRVFLIQGALVGSLGATLGVALAWVLVWAFTHFVKGADGLPLFDISLTAGQALNVALSATVAGMLAAIAPARRAAAMDPAQAIRT